MPMPAEFTEEGHKVGFETRDDNILRCCSTSTVQSNPQISSQHPFDKMCCVGLQ